MSQHLTDSSAKAAPFTDPETATDPHSLFFPHHTNAHRVTSTFKAAAAALLFLEAMVGAVVPVLVKHMESHRWGGGPVPWNLGLGQDF